jgi:hypothetical protein
MSRLDQITASDKAFASIRKAILTTMKDPGYQRRLNAAREAAPEIAAPAGPSVGLRAKPVTPAPARAIAPGGSMMGGGGRTVAASAVVTTKTGGGDQQGKSSQ